MQIHRNYETPKRPGGGGSAKGRKTYTWGHLKTLIHMRAEMMFPGYETAYREGGELLSSNQREQLLDGVCLVVPWLRMDYFAATGKPLTAKVLFDRLDKQHRATSKTGGTPRVAIGPEHPDNNAFLRKHRGDVATLIYRWVATEAIITKAELEFPCL